MKTNPFKDGVISDNSVGVGTVTRSMVLRRAVEHALIDGRTAREVSDSDWAKAQAELTGEPDPDETRLETAPETARWDPVAGSPGHKTLAVAVEDEDSEGHSDQETLVNEGLSEADHDQRLQAARASRP